MDENLPAKESLNPAFFLNEIRGSSEEFLRKSAKWARRQKGLNVITLVQVFVITSTEIGSISDNVKLAIALQEEFGMKFAIRVSVLLSESFARVILSQQHAKEDQVSSRIIVKLAAMMSEFYQLGWIDDHDAYLHCMTLSVSNKMSISLRTATLKAIVEAGMENLRKNDLDERFLFLLDKFEFEAGAHPGVFHQLHILTVKEVNTIRSLLVSIKFVTREAAAYRSVKDIKNLIRQYTARNSKKTLKKFETMGLKHSDQFEFVNQIVFFIAQGDYNQSEKYAEFCLLLMNGAFKPHQEKFLASLVKYLRVALSVHVSDGFKDDKMDEKLKFIAWLGFLYNWGVLTDEIMNEVIATLYDAEKKQEMLSLCIVELMKCIGPKYEKAQPSKVDELFKYFEANTSFTTEAIRPFTYSRLIEYRRNGWEDPDLRQQRRFLKEAAGQIRSKLKPQEEVPVEEEVEESSEAAPESEEPEVEVDNFQDVIYEVLENEHLMESEETVSVLKNFLLQSEWRVEKFIDTVLKHQKEDLQNIRMSLELLKKLSKAFDESPFDFQKSLVEQVNFQISQLGQPRSLSAGTRMPFTRLTIISAYFFQLGILSNKKFSLLLVSKGIHRLPVEILTHLSAKISMRIRLEGNKRLKEALTLLESSINKSSRTLCTNIENDLKDLSLELETLIDYETHSS